VTDAPREAERPPPGRKTAERIAMGGLVLLAVVLATRVLMTFAARVGFAFDLEWMEGGMLAHAWRLQRSLPLYVPPNPEFVPYVYPPGYSALTAALGDGVGLDYPIGRGLSIAATLASAAAIAALAGRHGGGGSGGLVGGLVGAACFLGLFRASGGFYDIVRPDALGLALLAWSVVLAAERARGADLASGLMLCAAFLVKHNYAAFGVPLVAMIGLRDGVWSAVRFTLASAVPALVMTGLLQWRSDGHFLTYILSVPGSHPMLWNRFWLGLPGEVGLVLWPTLVGAAGWLFATAWIEPRRPRAWLVGTAVAGVVAMGVAAWLPVVRGVPMTPESLVVAYGALVVVIGAMGALLVSRGLDWRVVGLAGIGGMALLVAALMRAHTGGFMNVLMPLHWVLAVALALGVGWALERARSPALPWLAAGVAAVQLGWLLRTVDFEEVRPTADVIRGGEALLADLEALCPEGPILMPMAAWVPVQLGRPPSVHLIAVWDLDHIGGPFYDESLDALRTAAREGFWPCAVQGSRKSAIRLPVSGFVLGRHYRRKRLVSREARGLHPMTGWPVSPLEVLEPKEPR